MLEYDLDGQHAENQCGIDIGAFGQHASSLDGSIDHCQPGTVTGGPNDYDTQSEPSCHIMCTHVHIQS